ncbi:MAG TPA: MOSC N-terminal beta barrel domain-containing protein [Candidatus Acidoferrales bacterium]|nr:MOSC N-terminal beta barrel domain-containing protein [Candidatus Acidoferrales bacterium]
MQVIGTVKEIWRYPVKSMAGERLQRANVGALGIYGDRGWAIRDEKAGEIRNARKLPALLHCTAVYLREPSGCDVPPAQITMPDGTTFRSDCAEASEKLSEMLGRPVTIWPVQPPSERDLLRRAKPDNPDMKAEMREVFGRLESEPLPDFSKLPPQILKFTSPFGTFFDAFPFHLLTTASLSALAGHNPTADFDSRRFRPNLLVETERGLDGLVEAEWSGRTLRIGATRIKVEIPTVRCVIPTLDQPGVKKDPSVLRTIVRDAAQNLGAYATIANAGTIALGDEVSLE